MWGEKYRDEVGLGRNDGDDLLDELAGDQAIKEAPARGEVRDRHRALCRTLGDRVRVRNAGQTLPWRSRKRGPLLCSPQMVALRQLNRDGVFLMKTKSRKIARDRSCDDLLSTTLDCGADEKMSGAPVATFRGQGPHATMC